MEAPESFPFSPPRVAAFLRRYHAPALPLCACPAPPPAALAELQAAYNAKVLPQVSRRV